MRQRAREKKCLASITCRGRRRGREGESDGGRAGHEERENGGTREESRKGRVKMEELRKDRNKREEIYGSISLGSMY